MYIKILLLLKSGDIQSNPGPRKGSVLKFCHWNLNGLAAHEFVKLSLIEGYINVIKNYNKKCFKEYLPIIRREHISNLKEWLVTEIKNERCFFRCLYRSPSQNREQFQSFCDSLDILMNNINSPNTAISIISGDFNGRFSKWYSFNTSEYIGKELDTITLTAGYTQIIEKPTHFTNH